MRHVSGELFAPPRPPASCFAGPWRKNQVVIKIRVRVVKGCGELDLLRGGFSP